VRFPDQLEERALLAVASLVGSHLQIDFTAAGTASESVNLSNNGTTIALSGNIAPASFGSGAVDQITIRDIGGSSGQLLSLIGGAAFVLSGGFSSTGVDRVETFDGTDIATTDNAPLAIAAPASIVLRQNSSFVTEDGGITLSANTAGADTSIYAGVTLFGTVETRGTGAVDIDGRGSPASPTGVKIHGGTGLVQSISALNSSAQGAITIRGTGGSGNSAYGIDIDGFGSTTNRVLSNSGKITLIGQGGNAGNAGVQSAGVNVANGAKITAANLAAISITGTAGIGATSSGVVILSGTVQTDGGDIAIAGTGGTTTTGSANQGIALTGATIASNSGAINLAGTGGTSTQSNGGVSSISSNIRSTTGAVSLLGTGGSGAGSPAISVDNHVPIASGISVSLRGDAIAIPNFFFSTTQLSAPLVTLVPKTAGRPIQIGAGDSSSALGLADFELDRINATTLRIGDAASGMISVVAANSPPVNVAWNVELISAGDVIFNAPFTTVGFFNPGSPSRGNLLLSPGAAGSVQPKSSSTDVTTQTNTGGAFATAFTSGSDLKINIAGLTANLQYDRLTAVGAVNLSGADLALAGGFVSSAGNVFTIVSATNVSGIFNGLPDNSELFFNGRVLRVNYTASTVTLTDVRPANQSPDARDDLATTNEDTSLSIAVLANDSDLDGDMLAISAASDPQHGSIRINVDGTLTYTPQANFHGTDAFSYTIIDGQGGSDTSIVTVTIQSVNDVPMASNDAATAAEDGSATIAVILNDADVDGDTLVVSAATDPPHGAATVNADGTITYVPDANYFGSDAFSYIVNDGQGGVATALVFVNIISVNDAPSALNDAANIDEDAPLMLAVLSNDSDLDGDPLVITAIVNPMHGTAVLSANGIITYTPAANFHGTDAFQYFISDEHGGSATAEVTITVLPRPDVDFGGRVFDDRDNNGLFDGLDAGIAGISVQLFNESNLAMPLATVTTAVDGTYLFDVDLGEGVYRIVAAQPAALLDGSEAAGALAGAVNNAADSNVISGIVVSGTIDDLLAGAYNFAELLRSRIQGLVWEDANNNSEVDFGEQAIAGVTIRLTGTDDRGAAVDRIMQTDSQGIFEFLDLRPSNAAGYTLTEMQPVNYADGVDVLGMVNGVVSGSNSADDVFSQIGMSQPGSDAINYNFAERPVLNGTVGAGRTATIGFWQNKNGQALIRSLNGGPDGTQLGGWLAATLPNMYGASAGDNNLNGLTNAEVATFFATLFKRNGKTAGDSGPPKLDAQVLAVALAVYVTNEHLAGTAAVVYGFTVDAAGLGASTFDIGTSGAAFGMANYSAVRVLDLLFAVNSRSRQGRLFDLNGDGDTGDADERLLRGLANDVFSGINELGDI
jgi:hypothetical protein